MKHHENDFNSSRDWIQRFSEYHGLTVWIRPSIIQNCLVQMEEKASMSYKPDG